MATIASSINPREIDNTADVPGRRAPLITGNQTYSSVTEMVCRVAEDPQPLLWYVLFGFSSLTAVMFLSLIGYLILTGVGIWGNMNPVFWAWPIVNFVFWVGIGHAGTLISAILFLFRQNWRTSINRAAEAMTICYLCGDLPWNSRWTSVACLLVASLSQFEFVDVASVP
jgi:molybdopterin-containing oxidoreductase family membrane subunit